MKKDGKMSIYRPIIYHEIWTVHVKAQHYKDIKVDNFFLQNYPSKTNFPVMRAAHSWHCIWVCKELSVFTLTLIFSSSSSFPSPSPSSGVDVCDAMARSVVGDEVSFLLILFEICRMKIFELQCENK